MSDYHMVGVDPGSPIYMVLLSPKGRLLKVTSPEHVALKGNKGWINSSILIRNILETWRRQVPDLMLAMETVGVRGNTQGISSVLKYVTSFYTVEGIAVGMGIPVLTTSPAAWRKVMIGTSTVLDNKEASRQAALQLWPEKGPFYFRRKLDHNAAEAALIAKWGLSNVG